MIICSIPSIKGGAWNEFTGKGFYTGCYSWLPTLTDLVLKHNRMTEIANENQLPIIGLVQAVSVEILL